MNIFRVYVSPEAIGVKILGEFNEVLGEFFQEGHSYREFLVQCEEAIIAWDCVELDSVWVEEFSDIVRVYGDREVFPKLFELLENA